MSDKTVEILMAVYNGEKYISEQIESILKQTYKNIRLLIRDNCSKDHTHKILADYKARYPKIIRVIYSEENVGIIGNFSALLEASSAQYVMFSDHDDVWLANKVAKSMDKMSEFEKKFGSATPVLIHSDLKVVNNELSLIHPSFWKYSKLDPKQTSLPRQLIHNQVTGCTTLLNNALINLARPIPQNIVMHDWWIGICAAALGKIGIVNEPLMLYRQHHSNDTGAKKYSVFSLLKRFSDQSTRERIKQNRKQMFAQANEFLYRQESLLCENTKNLVKAFIQLEHTSFLNKAYMMVKYRFYRVGILRNIITLFRPKI